MFGTTKMEVNQKILDSKLNTIIHQNNTIIFQNGHVIDLLTLVLRKENAEMATLDDILARAQRETTVIASIKAYVDGLKQQLDAANSANDPTKVQTIIDAMDANAAAEAAISNTPAAGTTS